jgi:predicted nucleotidyltransferase
MTLPKWTRKPLDPEWVKQEAAAIVGKLAAITAVTEVFWFGSSAEGKMTDQSDFDFLVVVDSEEETRACQKMLRQKHPLSSYPVDLVWVGRSRFDKMKNLGGVCLIAFEDGKQVFDRKKVFA